MYLVLSYLKQILYHHLQLQPVPSIVPDISVQTKNIQPTKTLNSDCSKCVNRRTVLTKLMTNNKTLRSQKVLLLNKLKSHKLKMRALSRKVLYSGHIINVNSSKVTVTYWVPNETEDDGEDEKMTVDKSLVDYIIGDLEFDG